MIDKVVGQRYRIVRLLGAGGMGSVYEATDERGGGRVAVKLITAEAAKNATALGRFEREARATMGLDTPHIVRVVDAGVDAALGAPYLVMERLEGEDVQQLVKRLGPLPPDLALRILAQACLGLAVAHEARVIHRDIKPHNFFLARGADGAITVKLLDFGIAKTTRDPADSQAETAGLTRTGQMIGSPLYMAPEQARGMKEIDHRADIWSLGVVLYQTLTGRTPHAPTDAIGDLIISICTETPPTIQELAPWVPPEIALVAQRAMRFDPAERYASATAMLADLRPLLPHGWEIRDEMLRPLDDAARAKIAPRLVEAPDAPPQRAGRTADPSLTDSSAATQHHDRGTSSAPGASIDGLGRTAPPATPARPSQMTLVAGATMALAAGGMLAYWLFASPPPKPASTAAAASPAATTTAAPIESAAKPHTVRLVILPDGATVEVDGAKSEVRDGVVEISGAIGSVHKVVVAAGGEEVTRDVVVAEGGPVPAKIQVEVKAVKAPATPRPVAPAKGPAPDLRNQR